MDKNTLSQSLVEIHKRIDTYIDKGISEDATKQSLIAPTLRALGWNVEDLDEVHPQFPTTAGGFADYALFVDGRLRYLVEAKPLDDNLNNIKWANQLVSYASATGTRWGVLTNGNEYRIYNAYAEVPIEQKVFYSVRLQDPATDPAEVLSLLSRTSMVENLLDSQWEAELENRRKRRLSLRVQSALRSLLEQTPASDRFLRLLRDQHSSSLSISEVREGLSHIRAQFEFKESDSKAVDPTPDPTRPIPIPKGLRVSLKDLVDAGIIVAPLDIHRNYKQKLHKASIGTDGLISFHGQSFHSPSGAGRAVRILSGAPPNSAQTAGWAFWKFVDTDGKAKPISELRQRFLRKVPS